MAAKDFVTAAVAMALKVSQAMAQTMGQAMAEAVALPLSESVPPAPAPASVLGEAAMTIPPRSSVPPAKNQRLWVVGPPGWVIAFGLAQNDPRAPPSAPSLKIPQRA